MIRSKKHFEYGKLKYNMREEVVYESNISKSPFDSKKYKKISKLLPQIKAVDE